MGPYNVGGLRRRRNSPNGCAGPGEGQKLMSGAFSLNKHFPKKQIQYQLPTCGCSIHRVATAKQELNEASLHSWLIIKSILILTLSVENIQISTKMSIDNTSSQNTCLCNCVHAILSAIGVIRYTIASP